MPRARALFACWSLACGGEPPPQGADGYRTRIDGYREFAALAADGLQVKYLAPADGAPVVEPLTADCYFQDMGRWRWHLEFLRSFSPLAELDAATYEAYTLAGAARRWWGGALALWAGAVHPDGGLGVVSFTVYAHAEGGGLDVAAIAQVYGKLAACASFSAGRLAYLPEDHAQQGRARAAAAELAAAGVPVVFPADLAAGLPAAVYSAGESYGTLRIVPRGEPLSDHGPRDVVVVQSAPADVSLLAGLLTAHPQSPHSHVNLRLIEKGVPSAHVADLYDDPWLAALDGLLVHVVAATSVRVEPATVAQAEAFWRGRGGGVTLPDADRDQPAARDFSRLRRADAAAYGAKAAALGELHAALPAAHRVEGFALPFSWYLRHLEAAGLTGAVDALLADPRVRADRRHKARALADLRAAIRAAAPPPALAGALADALRGLLGDAAETTFVRLRSSSNVEDLDALSGAGLYDSRTGCLGDDLDGDDAGPSRCWTPELAAHLDDAIARWRAELAAHPERVWLADLIADAERDRARERTVARALRRVWSSLWSERAFDDREYWGVDHRAALMGVAVNAAFARERANAVAVTGRPGGRVRLVSQVGEESVVRPDDPTAVAEVLTFARGAGDRPVDVRVTVRSSRVRGGGAVWSEADLETLAAAVFRAHDHLAAVYPVAPPAFDLEIKHTHDGRAVVKQARPFVAPEETP